MASVWTAFDPTAQAEIQAMLEPARRSFWAVIGSLNGAKEYEEEPQAAQIAPDFPALCGDVAPRHALEMVLPATRPVITAHLDPTSTCFTYYGAFGKYRYSPPIMRASTGCGNQDRRELIVVLLHEDVPITRDLVWNMRSLAFETSQFGGRHLVIAVLGATIPADLPQDLLPWATAVSQSNLAQSYPNFRRAAWPTDLVLLHIDEKFGRKHERLWIIEATLRVSGPWDMFFHQVKALSTLHPASRDMDASCKSAFLDADGAPKDIASSIKQCARSAEHKLLADLVFLRPTTLSSHAKTSENSVGASVDPDRDISSKLKGNYYHHGIGRSGGYAERKRKLGFDESLGNDFDQDSQGGIEHRLARRDAERICKSTTQLGYSTRGLLVVSRRLADEYLELCDELHRAEVQRPMLLAIAYEKRMRAVEIVLPKGSEFSGASSSWSVDDATLAPPSFPSGRRDQEGARKRIADARWVYAASRAELDYATWAVSWSCRPLSVFFPVQDTTWSGESQNAEL